MQLLRDNLTLWTSGEEDKKEKEGKGGEEEED